MRSSTFILPAVDGTAVHVYRWEPDGDARGVVQIVHGLAEHAARYERVAGALTDAGWAVYADDHRGHGQTASGPDELGLFAEERGWAKVVDDLHRLTDKIRQDHPDVPVVLFGHSMGSFLTQQHLFTFPGAVDAAVLSGSNGPVGLLGEVGAVVARIERLRQGKRGRSKLLKSMSFGAYNKPFEPARTEFDWLSRDPDEVDAYVADPLCGFDATNQLWIDLLSGLRVVSSQTQLSRIPPDLPIYIFSGDKDPVGEQGDGVRRLLETLEEAGLRDLTFKLYPDARHEMLNETNRDEVTRDLLEWLEAATEG